MPPGVWHEVKSPAGAKLLTIFSPGYADAGFMRDLSERHDIFER